MHLHNMSCAEKAKICDATVMSWHYHSAIKRSAAALVNRLKTHHLSKDERTKFKRLSTQHKNTTKLKVEDLQKLTIIE